MRSSTESSTVDPLIPLTLLEAVRDIDRPQGAAEAEYVPELLNKRLGTTETVYVQIRRYTEAVRRGQRISTPEVMGLARLIGRRPDAVDVFQRAGETTADIAYHRITGLSRSLVRVLPRFAARPLARRHAKKILGKYFGAALVRNGSDLRLRLPAQCAVAAEAGPEIGATYYEAGFQQLLTLLSLN